MQQSGIYRRHFNTYLFNFNDVLLTDGELFNSTLYTIDNTCHYIVHFEFKIFKFSLTFYKPQVSSIKLDIILHVFEMICKLSK